MGCYQVSLLKISHLFYLLLKMLVLCIKRKYQRKTKAEFNNTKSIDYCVRLVSRRNKTSWDDKSLWYISVFQVSFKEAEGNAKRFK